MVNLKSKMTPDAENDGTLTPDADILTSDAGTPTPDADALTPDAGNYGVIAYVDTLLKMENLHIQGEQQEITYLQDRNILIKLQKWNEGNFKLFL